MLLSHWGYGLFGFSPSFTHFHFAHFHHIHYIFYVMDRVADSKELFQSTLKWISHTMVLILQKGHTRQCKFGQVWEFFGVSSTFFSLHEVVRSFNGTKW